MRQTILKNIVFLFFFGTIEILFILRPHDSFAQDTTKKTKILVAYRTINTGFNIQPAYHEFKVGKRIAIRTYTSDKVIKGKIESISDSLLQVKDSSISIINISDIKSIKKIRGRPILIGGLTLTGLSGLSLLFFNRLEEHNYQQSGYSEDYSAGYLGVQMFSALFMVVGINVVIISVIDNATARQYKADKRWKFYVVTKN